MYITISCVTEKDIPLYIVVRSIYAQNTCLSNRLKRAERADIALDPVIHGF